MRRAVTAIAAPMPRAAPVTIATRSVITAAAGPRSTTRRRDRGLGRPAALVLLRARQPGAVEALLLVVERQHAESDRLAGVEGDAGEPVGRGARDVLEVRGAAADDDAERDHRIRPGLERRLGDDRQLEAARDPHVR